MQRMQMTPIPAIPAIPAAAAAHGPGEPTQRKSFSKSRDRAFARRLRLAVGLLAGLLTASGSGSPSKAGIVLLSRQSSIQATGGNSGTTGPGNFNLTGGTTSFDPFSNDLNNNTDATAVALADAHQYSVPGNSASTGLQGAYAEGTVQAELNAPDATARAQSTFDLTFQVTQGSAQYNFGGAFGTVGNGTAEAELKNLNPGGPSFVFAAEIEGGPSGQDASRTLSRQGILPPGVYGLNVSARTPGTSATSSAYYTVNLMLASSGAGNTPAGMPAAAPMPPAAWPGLITLGVLMVVAVRSRRRAAV